MLYLSMISKLHDKSPRAWTGIQNKPITFKRSNFINHDNKRQFSSTCPSDYYDHTNSKDVQYFTLNTKVNKYTETSQNTSLAEAPEVYRSVITIVLQSYNPHKTELKLVVPLSFKDVQQAFFLTSHPPNVLLTAELTAYAKVNGESEVKRSQLLQVHHNQPEAGQQMQHMQRESLSQQTQLDGKLMTDWNEVWPLWGQMLRLCVGALTRMAGRDGQCRIRMDIKEGLCAAWQRASSEPVFQLFSRHLNYSEIQIQQNNIFSECEH